MKSVHSVKTVSMVTYALSRLGVTISQRANAALVEVRAHLDKIASKADFGCVPSFWAQSLT